MAVDYIIGGLQLLSAAVNVLALGAFWISPGLRATANRFVINLLVANIIACLALTPALWLHGGLKTRFHMDDSAPATAESFLQNFKLQSELRKIHNSNMIELNEMTTIKPPQHRHHHHRSHGKVERDVDQADYVETNPFVINSNNIEESIESLVFQRDQQGNIRKISEKLDITNGKERDHIEIIEEIAAEPMAVTKERIVQAEPKVTIKQRSSTAHRAHAVFSENALIFDCTRFWGFDFAAAVGIVGDMIANGLGCVSLSWIASPSATELEVIVMDWLARFLDLPEFYLNTSEGHGGGLLQGTASEAMLSAILAAREDAVKRLKVEYPHISESDIRGKLVMYSSDQSNCCVEKTARLAAVSIHLLSVDNDFSLRGKTLQAAIEQDTKNGKFPFACIATFGTTGLCAFDNLVDIGPICRKNQIWLHIDAAYAGAALCCPEYRYLMKGIEYSDSFNFNLHKWMLVHFDSSAMWFRDTTKVVKAFTVDRTYLLHDFEVNSKAPDYRHWEIPLGHRFRALKVWFTMRILGADVIRENIRRHVRLASRFAGLVEGDSRFEIVGKQTLSLVCFRLKDSCDDTNRLLRILNERKNIYMCREYSEGKVVIRFVVNGTEPSEKDIDYAWNEIVTQTDEIFKENHNQKITEMKNRRIHRQQSDCRTENQMDGLPVRKDSILFSL